MKMRKTRKETIIEDVQIADAGAEGKAVARIEGMVVFVPFVVPGDVIDLKIYKKKKQYAEGICVSLKEASPLRREAQCPHFGICGGCKWQIMDYAAQLRYKEQQVRDNLERIGGIDTACMSKILGSDQIFYYRNKMEFTFSKKRWLKEGEVRDEEDWGGLGFHVPMVFDKVLPIERCVLQDDLSNRIRNGIRDYAKEHAMECYDIRNHTGYLRNIVIRNSTSGEWMVIVIVAEDRPQLLNSLLCYIEENFPEISTLQYIINEKWNDSYTDLEVQTYKGEGYITERMPNAENSQMLQFRVGPKSFYQTNSAQAYRLYSVVGQYAGLNGGEIVYDLYTGTGTIAQFVAGRSKKVVGIEYVEAAIADAKENARLNGIENCNFFAGDMAKVLTGEFIEQQGHPDVVITDPPRAGMHEKVVEQLLECAAERIVYVSCNPATQARDLAMLGAKYEVIGLQPVDMFPHTQHVENVACLRLRKS